jgi:sterol desaturase/sphingolipid hydroxylase (fatty acid hydroxylase superfamily)
LQPICAFYQDPLDLLLTNSLPTFCTFVLLKSIGIRWTPFEYSIMSIYKMFIEISGHVGKRLYPVPSFVQCIWLPQWLHIELYCEDHDVHHSFNNCNYGKRFSLWDKLFGTFRRNTLVRSRHIISSSSG